MAKLKVVVLGAENDPLSYERAEMKDLDVEFVQAKPKSDGEAMEVVRDADAVMLRGDWGREPIINATTKCQVMTVYSHGFNHIDVEAMNDKGIILTNGTGMCAEEVSNQAVSFVLALNRQVVRKLSGWRMKTLVYDPYIPPWTIQEYGVEQVFDINELCRRADYVVVVVPLNDETFHMIGEEQFNNMKKTAFFVNVCRGSVHDEKALIKALQDKKIRGAGLDVFEKEPVDPKNPLLQMENVITAPHLAGASTRSAWLSRQRAAQQVAAVLRGEWPMGAQNPIVASKIKGRQRSKGRAPAAAAGLK